jgi:prepilin-type N-terminal cleavage/methylation domain-containing protein
MSHARSDSGFTLIEILIAATLMLIVLGATLTVFDGMLTERRDLDRQTEAQEAARLAMTAIARDLRNVAEPNPAVGDPAVAPPSIDSATADSLVVRTVDPAGPGGTQNTFRVRRVRYCLDADTGGRGQLYVQTQTWTTPATPSVPSTATCPGTGWQATKTVASSLTNRQGGRSDRPLFAYTPPTFTDTKAIQSVIPTFWVDIDPSSASRQAHLSSALFMRNQNRPPVSDAGGPGFTVNVSGAGGVSLNAYAFEDPDGGTLSYVWYDGTAKIGTGPYLQWVVPKSQRNQNHTFTLKVFDDKGAETDAPSQTVLVT